METTFERKKTMTENIEGLKAVTIGGVALGTIVKIFESLVGMSAIAYMALVALFILDFFTGIGAAVAIGRKKGVVGRIISSKKMPRIIGKIAVITIVLTAMNIFAKEIGAHSIPWTGMKFNYYTWIYYCVLNISVLTQVWSVMENLSDMEVRWATVTIKVFESAAGKIWIFKYLKKKK